MRKYLVALVAAFALIGATQFNGSEVEAASGFCPNLAVAPVQTIFVGGTVGGGQALVSYDQSLPRVAIRVNYYVFDVADNGHRETVVFGSPRDFQLRSLFGGLPTSCDVKYGAYRIDLSGAGHYETVTAGSIREAQLRSIGYIQ